MLPFDLPTNLLPLLVDGERVPWPADTVADTFGEDAAAMIAEAEGYQAGLNQRATLRGRIAKDVGDTPSILGTTADVAQLLALFTLIDRIADAQAGDDYAAFRTAKNQMIQSLTGFDFSAKGAEILQGLSSENLRITAMVKQGGVGEVIDEAFDRATGVVHAMIESAQTNV